MPEGVVLWCGLISIIALAGCAYYPLHPGLIPAVATAFMAGMAVMLWWIGPSFLLGNHEGMKERAQIREWLVANNIPVYSDWNFYFNIRDAEGHHVDIFEVSKESPIIAISSNIVVSRAEHLQTLAAMSEETQGKLVDDIRTELTRLKLEYDISKKRWEVRITAHVVFDKAITRQKFLDDLQRINQGIMLTKSILSHYIK